MSLEEYRSEIDAIDAELVELFGRRMALSAAIAQHKRENGLPVLDEGRERAVLDRAEGRTLDETLRPLTRRFFQGLLALSRDHQHALLEDVPQPAFAAGAVGYLGPEGSFSHEAAAQAFGDGAQFMPFAGFEELVGAVAQGRLERAVLPVENSLTGAVYAAVDLLGAQGIKALGETVVRVRHCVLGLPDAQLADVQLALSHPQPLEQCRRYLRGRGWRTQACASTTEAAQAVARGGDPMVAAIASEDAAQRYGLTVLQRDVQDHAENYTRFLVLAPQGAPDAIDADKISIVFVVAHTPGALFGALRAFADSGVNVLNLQSRPIPGSPWQYCFHMDFQGNLADEAVGRALEHARKSCRSLTILGNYRRWEGNHG